MRHRVAPREERAIVGFGMGFEPATHLETARIVFSGKIEIHVPNPRPTAVPDRPVQATSAALRSAFRSRPKSPSLSRSEARGLTPVANPPRQQRREAMRLKLRRTRWSARYCARYWRRGLHIHDRKSCDTIPR